MALSFAAVKKAYEVLNELKKRHLPELSINSWPQDTAKWERSERLNPPLNTLLGYDKKYDDGWESLYFIVDAPSEELKRSFEELKGQVPNSSISRVFEEDSRWQFGWF